VGHVTAEVLPHDNMPCRTMSSIEFFLDLSGNVLLDVVLFEGSGGNVDALLLHLFAHVNVLDDCLGAVATATFTDARTGVGCRGGGWGVVFLSHGGASGSKCDLSACCVCVWVGVW
jgi:hypothetical protein